MTEATGPRPYSEEEIVGIRKTSELNMTEIDRVDIRWLATLDQERALLSKCAAAGRDVMETLELYGARIVPHLLDGDENAGQRLRDVLAEVQQHLATTGSGQETQPGKSGRSLQTDEQSGLSSRAAPAHPLPVEVQRVVDAVSDLATRGRCYEPGEKIPIGVAGALNELLAAFDALPQEDLSQPAIRERAAGERETK